MTLPKCCSLIFDEKWQQSCVQKEGWLKFPYDSVAPESLVSGLRLRLGYGGQAIHSLVTPCS